MGESEKAMYYEKIHTDGFGFLGCCQAVFSNRLPYWLGTNGKLKCGCNNF